MATCSIEGKYCKAKANDPRAGVAASECFHCAHPVCTARECSERRRWKGGRRRICQECHSQRNGILYPPKERLSKPKKTKAKKATKAKPDRKLTAKEMRALVASKCQSTKKKAPAKKTKPKKNLGGAPRKHGAEVRKVVEMGKKLFAAAQECAKECDQSLAHWIRRQMRLGVVKHNRRNDDE
jgi:hypothetical protein